VNIASAAAAAANLLPVQKSCSHDANALLRDTISLTQWAVHRSQQLNSFNYGVSVPRMSISRTRYTASSGASAVVRIDESIMLANFRSVGHSRHFAAVKLFNDQRIE
jgi:hypothetical protein